MQQRVTTLNVRTLLSYYYWPAVVCSKDRAPRQSQLPKYTSKTSSQRNRLCQPLVEDLHEILDIEAYNVRQHRMSVRAWQRATDLDIEPDILRQSERETEEGEGVRDHYWWRRIHPSVSAPEPDPVYT